MVIMLKNIPSCTPGEWYRYFYLDKKKNTKQMKILYESFKYFESNYPFLDETQHWGRVYQFLGIPHVCGKVNRGKLKEVYKNDKNYARINKLKINIEKINGNKNDKVRKTIKKENENFNMENKIKEISPHSTEFSSVMFTEENPSKGFNMTQNIDDKWRPTKSNLENTTNYKATELHEKKMVRFKNAQILQFDKFNSSQSEVSVSSLLDEPIKKINNCEENMHKPYFVRLNDSLTNETTESEDNGNDTGIISPDDDFEDENTTEINHSLPENNGMSDLGRLAELSSNNLQIKSTIYDKDTSEISSHRDVESENLKLISPITDVLRENSIRKENETSPSSKVSGKFGEFTETLSEAKFTTLQNYLQKLGKTFSRNETVVHDQLISPDNSDEPIASPDALRQNDTELLRGTKLKENEVTTNTLEQDSLEFDTALAYNDLKIPYSEVYRNDKEDKEIFKVHSREIPHLEICENNKTPWDSDSNNEDDVNEVITNNNSIDSSTHKKNTKNASLDHLEEKECQFIPKRILLNPKLSHLENYRFSTSTNLSFSQESLNSNLQRELGLGFKLSNSSCTFSESIKPDGFSLSDASQNSSLETSVSGINIESIINKLNSSENERERWQSDDGCNSNYENNAIDKTSSMQQQTEISNLSENNSYATDEEIGNNSDSDIVENSYIENSVNDPTEFEHIKSNCLSKDTSCSKTQSEGDSAHYQLDMQEGNVINETISPIKEQENINKISPSQSYINSEELIKNSNSENGDALSLKHESENLTNFQNENIKIKIAKSIFHNIDSNNSKNILDLSRKCKLKNVKENLKNKADEDFNNKENQIPERLNYSQLVGDCENLPAETNSNLNESNHSSSYEEEVLPSSFNDEGTISKSFSNNFLSKNNYSERKIAKKAKKMCPFYKNEILICNTSSQGTSDENSDVSTKTNIIKKNSVSRMKMINENHGTKNDSQLKKKGSNRYSLDDNYEDKFLAKEKELNEIESKSFAENEISLNEMNIKEMCKRQQIISLTQDNPGTFISSQQVIKKFDYLRKEVPANSRNDVQDMSDYETQHNHRTSSLSTEPISSVKNDQILEDKTNLIRSYNSAPMKILRKLQDLGGINVQQNQNYCKAVSKIIIKDKVNPQSHIYNKNNIKTGSSYKRSNEQLVKCANKDDFDADSSSGSSGVSIYYKKIKRRKKKSLTGSKIQVNRYESSSSELSSDDPEFMGNKEGEKENETEYVETNKKTATTNALLIARNKDEATGKMFHIGGKQLTKENEFFKTSIVKQQINKNNRNSDTPTTKAFISPALARRMFYLNN